MKKLSDVLVIQIFVLLHVAVALLSRLFGLSDELVLTMLTMLLSVVLCWRKQVSVTMMAGILILVNVAGFLLSKVFGSFFGPLFSWNTMYMGPVIVSVTTETVGFGVLGVIWLLRKLGVTCLAGKIGVWWLMFAFLLILTIRLVMMFISRDDKLSENLELNVLVDYLFSSAVVFYLAYCSIMAESAAAREKENAHKAQYDYLRLKQRVEPHFMFNNLNVLDELVCSGSTEAASTFIHKLAATYRYMIGNEPETMVTLREEMNFVGEYVDLLKVRFEDAFDIASDIPDGVLQLYVVPCSVQLLVENAIKHNVASSENPLLVRIAPEGKYLTVSNPLRPRVGPAGAGGLGLRYIQQQYHDAAGKDIVVSSEKGEFTVKLPLIYGGLDNRR